MSDSTRQMEVRLEIEAPTDAVWKALTDAQELERWFPLHAKATPGKGGKIWMSWGQPWEGDASIEIWEPGRHLRIQWPWQGAPGDAPPAVPVAVDYFLESRAGGTVLRLVHSGFGRDAKWDNEVESVRHGWRFELQSLKRYLERHRGQNRRVVWARREFVGSRNEFWPRLIGPEGLGGHGRLGHLAAGDAFAFGPKGAEALRGRVMVHEGPRQFVGTAENFNDGLVRIELEGPAVDAPDAKHHLWVWLSAYGVEEARLAKLESEWRAMAERLLPEGR